MTMFLRLIRFDNDTHHFLDNFAILELPLQILLPVIIAFLVVLFCCLACCFRTWCCDQDKDSLLQTPFACKINNLLLIKNLTHLFVWTLPTDFIEKFIPKEIYKIFQELKHCDHEASKLNKALIDCEYCNLVVHCLISYIADGLTIIQTCPAWLDRILPNIDLA